MNTGAGLAWPGGHRGMAFEQMGAVANPLLLAQGEYWQIDQTTTNANAVYRYERNLLRSSGTVVANFGGGRTLDLENAGGLISDVPAFEETVHWSTATADAETAVWTIKLASAGTAAQAFQVTPTQTLHNNGTVAAPGIAFASHPGTGISNSSGSMIFNLGGNNFFGMTTGGAFQLTNGGRLQFGVNDFLRSDHDNLAMALRNETTAETFRTYNTFTSATSYERAGINWAANVFTIGTEKGSGGGTAREFALAVDGTNKIRMNTTGLAFYNAAPVAQPVSAALTNNITAGGTNDTFTNWTDLTTYATDAAAIRNAVHQCARAIKRVDDNLRTLGLQT